MEKVDFLFIYESRVRELENDCLLKYELERRGYSVALLNTWYCIDHKFKHYSAKVVISHALMNDGVFDFIKQYAGKIRKLVNMQCEQIGTNEDNTDNTRFHYTGMAKKGVHIAWGKITFDRLMNQSQIPKEQIKLTGQIALDFCRPEFDNYYRSKEDLLKEFKLSKYERINLFISSFSYVNLPDHVFHQSNINNKSDFAVISVKSQEIILEWIERLLCKEPSQLFIYRPHPAEASNLKLKSMENQYENFCVISKYSVKQWIKIVDQIFTWYSTSIVEVYASGKNCSILRPIKIPYPLDVELYNGARFITNYMEFEASLTKLEKFPINHELLDQYYYIDTKEAAYMKITNALENVYENDTYIIVDDRAKKKINWKQMLKAKLSYILLLLLKRSGIKNKSIQLYVDNRIKQVDQYTKELQLKNYATDDEISNIVYKIKSTLET
ncbi:MAG: surface carbohydrate biosynthesis protein [Mobilitalea sp.]